MSNFFFKIKDWIIKYWSIIIVGIALLQGLLFIFLSPPWQHYDEPGHFEYAWLVANLDHWPNKGDYNTEMRREVAASMIENDFYNGSPNLPNLLATEPPTDIGISQLGDVPLYYFLASLPLRIFKYTDITFQLYTVRFVSLILFLLTTWGAIGICQEIFGKYHPLTWMVPLFMVFLPPFASLMTAVNNDVAAIAFSTFFLWVSIRIIQRGLDIWHMIWLIIMLVACVLSKSTTLMVMPLFLLVIGIGIYRVLRKRIALYFMGLISILAIALMFSWNKSAPSFFYARQDRMLPTRMKSKIAPVGNYIFAVETQNTEADGYYQMLSPTKLKQLSGEIVTIGVWMWADQPVDLRFPDIIINNKEVFNSDYVHLEAEPHFYTFTGQVPENGKVGWLMVYPSTSKEKVGVYSDGLILTKGDYSASSPPIFQDSQASSGVWNGNRVTNILSNGSGEKFWPILRTPLSNFINSYLHFSSPYFWSFLDLSGTGWYYQADISWLSQTFWVKFGWAQITLRGSRFFWVFSVLAIAGLTGTILAGWKYKKQLSWVLVIILTIDLLGTFWITLLRGMGSWITSLLLPAARYAYPAIIPVAITLCGGWYYVTHNYLHRFRTFRNIGSFFFFAGLFLYDILSIYSIYQFYRR
jgi:hypothetical protein